MKRISILIIAFVLFAIPAWAIYQSSTFGNRSGVAAVGGCVLGDETQYANTSGYAQYRIKISRFQAGCSGDLATALSYIDENQFVTYQVKFCIYTDNAGEPGTLIDESDEKTITQGTSAYWQSWAASDGLSFSPVDGTYYWVGTITNLATNWQYYGSTGGLVLEYTHTSFVCPASWPVESDGSANGPVSAYVNIE